MQRYRKSKQSRSKNRGASRFPTQAGETQLRQQVVWRPWASLRPYPSNPREHPEAQIQALMKALAKFWTIPILVDENGTILCGHARHEAAGRLGMDTVPTITISGLSDAEKRAVVIADNRLPEKAVWDAALLREQLGDLIAVDFDVELTGFSTCEVDLIIDSEILPSAEEKIERLAERAKRRTGARLSAALSFK
jgi:ParB-like chromosome segregation protein Spo0J